MSESTRNFRFKLQRFSAEGRTMISKSYELRLDRFETVLSALLHIKESLDPTLGVRYSCRMGVCGSCGMVVNGRPRLACETNVYSLGSAEISVGPMEGHPLLRDLVCDFDEFFENHSSVDPWLVRTDVEEKFSSAKEFPQTRSEQDQYLPFANCIKCGLCVDACPVANTNPTFVGPQALSQALRYNLDSRDQGSDIRLELIDRLEGVWGCEFAGSCSRVCPKGVDPALAIQLLKLDVAKHATGRPA